jgi:hypothetical protein
MTLTRLIFRFPKREYLLDHVYQICISENRLDIFFQGLSELNFAKISLSGKNFPLTIINKELRANFKGYLLLAFNLKRYIWFFIGYWILSGLDFYPAFFILYEWLHSYLLRLLNRKNYISDGQ